MDLVEKQVQKSTFLYFSFVILYLNVLRNNYANDVISLQRLNGVLQSTFEGHVAEVVWRNHHATSNIYQAFFRTAEDSLYIRR